jgi:cobalt-zinc-cadmium efflux system membrane fusion protein
MRHLQQNKNSASQRRLTRWIPGLFLALALLPIAACSGAGEEAGHGDEHGEEHAEGEPIQLSTAQVAAAGIALYTAGPGLVETRLSLPAIVEPDVDATCHVTPKTPGVVRAVHAGLGQRVEGGDLLCVIDSVELGVALADYREAVSLAAVAVEQLSGETRLFAKRLAATAAGFEGRIEVRQSILEREQELREKQVSTVRPLLEAERALREAELAKGVAITELEAERDARLLVLKASVKQTAIEEASALGRLAALGIQGSAVKELVEREGVYPGTYSVHAARSGVITARSLSVGKFVEVGDELFEIQDLSRVWVMASVFEDDLRFVKNGQAAEVTLHAFPGEVFHGSVTLLDTTLDAASRSLALRIELGNSGVETWGEKLPFRPGMFGDVSLIIESHQAELAVPESAIVHEVDAESIFVRTGEGRFEKRVVRLLGGDADLVEVVSVHTEGDVLRAGDQVATSGTLVLKALDHADELVGHDD